MHERQWRPSLRAGDLSIMRNQFGPEVKARRADSYFDARRVDTVHNTWAGVGQVTKYTSNETVLALSLIPV
jgi:hypothetical protein